MFGYYENFGCGRGMGRGGGFGFRHGCFRRGMGRGVGLFGPGSIGETEIEALKRYREHVDLRKKDLEAEIRYIDEKIASLDTR